MKAGRCGSSKTRRCRYVCVCGYVRLRVWHDFSKLPDWDAGLTSRVRPRGSGTNSTYLFARGKSRGLFSFSQPPLDRYRLRIDLVWIRGVVDIVPEHLVPFLVEERGGGGVISASVGCFVAVGARLG